MYAGVSGGRPPHCRGLGLPLTWLVRQVPSALPGQLLGGPPEGCAGFLSWLPPSRGLASDSTQQPCALGRLSGWIQAACCSAEWPSVTAACQGGRKRPALGRPALLQPVKQEVIDLSRLTNGDNQASTQHTGWSFAQPVAHLGAAHSRCRTCPARTQASRGRALAVQQAPKQCVRHWQRPARGPTTRSAAVARQHRACNYERQKKMITASMSRTTIATVSIHGLPRCSAGSVPGFFMAGGQC